MLAQNRIGRGAIALRGMSLVLVASLAGAAKGGVISDASFFNFQHTHLNFEADGAGTPVTLLQGQSAVMPTNAYANKGLTFTSPIRWVNDGNAAFDAAQTVGGSPTIAIPSSMHNTVEFTFAVPVRAFGAFVVNNAAVDAAGPTFTAYNASGQVLETVTFGAPFHDGQFTAGNTIAKYGFMGFTTTQDIARIVMTKQAAIFDDFRYGVPAPGALALLGFGGVLVSRRRR
jgi:hypothetical protein